MDDGKSTLSHSDSQSRAIYCAGRYGPAMIFIFDANQRKGFLMSHNTVCWVDIPVTNIDRAMKFYTAVLGEAVSKQTMPGMEFALLPHAEDNVSGCLVVMHGNQPSATGPLVYLSVEGRIDDAIKQARDGGGKILNEKEQIGPYGFRAIVLDSEGNRVALHSQKA
jgi:predicted enzyme related to lactoylglutathione lyase